MTAETINILLIEDNTADARLIEIMLEEASEKNYKVFRASTFSSGKELMQEMTPHVLLLDLSLPDSFGLETITSANDLLPEVPIIVLTGRNDEDFSVEVVKAGAQDYLVKGQIDSSLLTRSIRYSIQRKTMEVNLRKSEENLRSKNNELIRINKALDRFVYIISHDLKKPTANILGLLSLYAKEFAKNQSEKGAQILDKLNFSAQQLRKMIQDLLETTRREANPGKNLELIDFKRLYQDVAAGMEQLILQSHADIKTDFNRYPLVHYSYQDLQSILSNLLTNAIKYRSPERNPEILVKTQKGDEGPELIVKDNGRGMNLEEVKDRIFKKYQRFANEQNDSEGTGLGLWIVKETVEKNGGRVDVESNPGTGTTFIIHF